MEEKKGGEDCSAPRPGLVSPEQQQAGEEEAGAGVAAAILGHHTRTQVLLQLYNAVLQCTAGSGRGPGQGRNLHRAALGGAGTSTLQSYCRLHCGAGQRDGERDGGGDGESAGVTSLCHRSVLCSASRGSSARTRSGWARCRRRTPSSAWARWCHATLYWTELYRAAGELHPCQVQPEVTRRRERRLSRRLGP